MNDHEERIAQLEADVAALTSIIASESAQPSMTPFARRVGDVVAAIPRGQVRSYGEVALAAGSPDAARAIGRALTTVVSAGIPIPWWRVVRLDRQVRDEDPFSAERRLLLAAEGIDQDLFA